MSWEFFLHKTICILDTDTDNSHIFNHKGGIQLVPNNNNNYGAQFPTNYLKRPAFEAPQQNIQQQWPHSRNDWPHLQEEFANKPDFPQTNSAPINNGEKEEADLKHSVKKQHKEKESSEEYSDSDQEDDSAKTTEAPKKVSFNFWILTNFLINHSNFTETTETQEEKG